jgi:hypothetical protein
MASHHRDPPADAWRLAWTSVCRLTSYSIAGASHVVSLREYEYENEYEYEYEYESECVGQLPCGTGCASASARA